MVVSKMAEKAIRLTAYIFVGCLMFSSALFASGPLAERRPSLFDRNRAERDRNDRRSNGAIADVRPNLYDRNKREVEFDQWRGSRPQNTYQERAEDRYMLSSPYYGYGASPIWLLERV